MEKIGFASIRVTVGLLLAYHGLEVFRASQMQEYANWDMFKNNSLGLFLVYFGKGSEFVAGLLLALGLFTRLAGALTAFTMLSICFFVGHGKFWYEDQHPFLFALFGLLYLFVGGGEYSIYHKFRKD